MAKPECPVPHASPVLDVARQLRTDIGCGLLAQEARARLQTLGPNRLRQEKRRSPLVILLHQFGSVIVWLLAFAAGLSFAFGDNAEGLSIILVLIINAAIGFFTELRAERSMEALVRIAEVHTRVRRGRATQVIDARELVPGDLVVLEAGDIVTADLRLSQASNLAADESVLTGESTPVEKATTPIDANAPIGDRTSMAFKGSAITRGSGEGIVVATGMDTEIGRIAKLTQSARGETAPLERRLDRLGNRLVWLTLALAVLTIGAGIARGHAIASMIQTGVALAVAAVPEGLPVVATLCLARGMWRMSARNALMTRLSSVETLGATTVILTDKTGTLTENRMSVVRYLLGDGDFVFDADHREQALATHDECLAWALRIGVLCNNAKLKNALGDDQAGDPMEVALLSAARAAGYDHGNTLSAFPELREFAFDPDRKMMATLHRDGEHRILAVKGAVEAVLDACSQVLTGSGETRALGLNDRRFWLDRNARAARDGLRLLALAMARPAREEADPYHDLTLVGLVGLLDPLRSDVRAAVEASRKAGVRVIMLTGDHADTARAIALQAGLGDGELVVIEGREIARLDVAKLDEVERDRILNADAFARVAPETKLALVSLYQQAGHVVAMTGDGVNDAPALKKADIGIAMGQRGTEVAKQAAHMILRDDAFSTIIAAMHQGRVIFENIRKFMIYLMSCNISEVLVVGLAVSSGLPMPLVPLQILYLNLVTDVFPAFALGFGRGDDSVMDRPPRSPAEPLIMGRHWALMAVLGSAITAATLGAFGLAMKWLGLDSAASITVAFVTLSLAQLWNVFNVRDPGTGPVRNDVTRNPYVWGATALCLGLVALALWLPALSGQLSLRDPGAAALALAVAASLVPLAVGQIWIRLVRDFGVDAAPRRDGFQPLSSP